MKKRKSYRRSRLTSIILGVNCRSTQARRWENASDNFLLRSRERHSRTHQRRWRAPWIKLRWPSRCRRTSWCFCSEKWRKYPPANKCWMKVHLRRAATTLKFSCRCSRRTLKMTMMRGQCRILMRCWCGMRRSGLDSWPTRFTLISIRAPRSCVMSRSCWPKPERSENKSSFCSRTPQLNSAFRHSPTVTATRRLLINCIGKFSRFRRSLQLRLKKWREKR